MSDVQLLVNGKKHGGWKRIQITRSIESIAGSFTLDISDRWLGQAAPWPIGEEDAARIEIDGDGVIDGFVDKRGVTLSGSDRGISIEGRDRSAALVDCSAVLDRWTFRNTGVLEIARKLAAPFDILVAIQTGMVLPKPAAKLVVSPGDSAFEVIARAAQQAGVLVVNDGGGGILLTRAGSGRAEPLIEGQNILTAAVEYNAADRFRRYRVVTQIAGTDEASGSNTRIRAEALDLGVRRVDRVLILRPETGMTAEFARRRANWEANVRRGRAQTVTVTVQGWRQSTGALWPVNALADVQSPAIGVRGTMLITKTDFGLSDAGETTALSLVDPGSFAPEPTQSKTKPSGTWKELAGGAR